MLKGNLTPRGNLRGELTGGIFYGTMDYTELINKPSINSVELNGNKTLEDLGIDIPTELSELTNDVGFITSADVPTATSQLTNDSGFITSSDLAPVAVSGDYDDLTDKPTIPTLTSQLTNDSGFITSSDIPTNISSFNNDRGYITSADIPTDVSAFTNDAGYITSADIPTDVSAFTNDAGYISNSDLMTATASGSIATFDNGGDDIPLKSCVVEVASGNSECNIVNISDQTKKTYFDGLLDGTYNYCDLGDFSWSTTSQNRWYSTGISSVVKAPLSSSAKCGLICTGYDEITADETYLQNEGLAIGTNGLILIYDSALVGKTSAEVKTALTGVKVIYPLSTPITPTITEEQFNELCTAFGINYNSYNIPFGITTTDNGTLDVIKGELTVGGTTTQLTGIKPTTFSGDNNFSADTGNISLEYFTNKADSLAELIKAFVL